MDIKITSLKDLNPAAYNPRQIDDAALTGLKYSLTEFGDLSGIVFNARTGSLVAAEYLGRTCYGQELKPIYMDVTLRRFRNLFPEAEIHCLNRDFNFKKLFGESK